MAILDRDLRVPGDPYPFPHLAAVASARELLIATAQPWAVAGDCGCVLLRLDPTTTRREMEDVGVLIYRLGTDTLATAAIPPPSDPAACLAWTERAALGAGLHPVDPATRVDPSHAHGPVMHPPRDRIGWLRTTYAAWPRLPQPLRLRDLVSGDEWAVGDPADLATHFDDYYAHPIVTPLPATAETLRLLARDELLPLGLARRVQNALLRDREHPRATQRRPLIRLLRELHDPPAIRDWDQAERAVIRRRLIESRTYYPLAAQELRPSDFERGTEGTPVIDGMSWEQWLAVQRATWRRGD